MKPALQIIPEQASSFAGQVDALFYFLIAVTVLFSVSIVAVIALFSVRYKRRRQEDRPEEIHGSTKLEITWTVIPFILAMIMFFWGAHVYFQYAQAPEADMELLVTGKQWMWKIQHPDGTREINEIHVPLGKNIKVTMTSEDVIHSLYLPAFRTKMDAVPGRYTSLWFRPEKIGTYFMFCAEYCGTEHSLMGGHITVMEPEDYQAWLSGQTGDPALTPVAAGQRLFGELGCVACHGTGSGKLGPSLAGILGTQVEFNDGTRGVVDDDYLRESILHSQTHLVKGYQPLMPTFQGQINETQLMQLIAYVKSLGPPAEDSAGTPGEQDS